MKFRLSLLAVSLFLITIPSAWAQEGDVRDAQGQRQVDPIPADKIPPQPVLSPEQSLATFKIEPGFHIELVASEPLVHDPVAMAFGADGRIWVAEMSSYMPNVDGTGESQSNSAVVVLESSHNDGHLDKRVVFADHMVLPRALALIRDGILIGEPPHLWFYTIIDGDKAGPRVEITKDYGNNYDPQNAANGLMWGLDNWIYSSAYFMRIRNTDGEWQLSATRRHGQWGVTQDDYGRLVFNSNEDQFRINLIPSAYVERNLNYRHSVGVNVDPIHDQTVWPVAMTPGVNRGYWKDILRTNGTLAKTTSACGPLIYRGDNFPPEYRGNAFVCEPAGNTVIRDVLQETNGTMTGHEAYADNSFLGSSDERFRPVNLYNGPDGAMYMVDFHHGVLEHRISLTTYLRRQIKSRNLETPLHLGRIYRITYGASNPARVTLEDLSSAQLVEKLASPNGWIQDTAQRLLIERANPNVIDALKDQAIHSPNPVAQIHTAWTLDGMGQTDKQTLFSLLASPPPKVRAAAIRLSENFMHSPPADEILSRLISLAQTDLDPDVQLQLACTFGQTSRPETRHGLWLVASNSAARPMVREAIVTSLYQHETEFAAMLSQEWKEDGDGRGPLLQDLAECVINSRDTNHIWRLLETAAAAPQWQQTALLDGLIARPSMKKLYLTAQPSGLSRLRAGKKLAARIQKLDRVLTWPEQPGFVPPPYVPPLTADEQKAYDLGLTLFNATCAACHQTTGLGAHGVAPPLADSEWVTGSSNRLARIVLQGVQGKITAAGENFNSTMPSWATFNDEQLASILTYIRRSWEHGAPPIHPDTIKAIREATARHDGAWTSDDLSKLP
jgi:mono/diheme cytochrome c family protein/glucose/arabinose dehydrogenase